MRTSSSSALKGAVTASSSLMALWNECGTSLQVSMPTLVVDKRTDHSSLVEPLRAGLFHPQDGLATILNRNGRKTIDQFLSLVTLVVLKMSGMSPVRASYKKDKRRLTITLPMTVWGSPVYNGWAIAVDDELASQWYEQDAIKRMAEKYPNLCVEGVAVTLAYHFMLDPRWRWTGDAKKRAALIETFQTAVVKTGLYGPEGVVQWLSRSTRAFAEFKSVCKKITIHFLFGKIVGKMFSTASLSKFQPATGELEMCISEVECEDGKFLGLGRLMDKLLGLEIETELFLVRMRSTYPKLFVDWTFLERFPKEWLDNNADAMFAFAQGLMGDQTVSRHHRVIFRVANLEGDASAKMVVYPGESLELIFPEKVLSKLCTYHIWSWTSQLAALVPTRRDVELQNPPLHRLLLREDPARPALVHSLSASSSSLSHHDGSQAPSPLPHSTTADLGMLTRGYGHQPQYPPSPSVWSANTASSSTYSSFPSSSASSSSSFSSPSVGYSRAPDGTTISQNGPPSQIPGWSSSSHSQYSPQSGASTAVYSSQASPSSEKSLSSAGAFLSRSSFPVGAPQLLVPDGGSVKSVRDWAVSDVEGWLRNLSLTHLVEVFARNKVDGPTLVEMSEDELRNDLGVSALGDRKKIMREKSSLMAARSPRPQVSPRTSAIVPEDEISCEALTFVKLLGSGAFGEVWLAMWHHKTKVAVKFVLQARPGEPISSREEQNFLAEIALLRKVRHPNIVSLYGVARDPTRGLMLVVEYLEGGSLLHYLQGHFPLLDHPKLVKICLDISSAMDHIQRIGIIHRDLAARNILVHTQGDDILCKLSDFGLGKLTQDSQGYYVADQANPLPLKWTAPEALLLKRWSSASDVWSFGVCVWEIFSGGHEPYADWECKLLDGLKRGDRLRRPTACHVDFWGFVVRCFEQDPHARPTFEELHNFFDAQLENVLVSDEDAEDSGVTSALYSSANVYANVYSQGGSAEYPTFTDSSTPHQEE